LPRTERQEQIEDYDSAQKNPEQSATETFWLNKLNLHALDSVLWPLLTAYLCLNFLDLYTTSIAIGGSQAFQEYNIIAAKLFSMKFGGFLLAIILKFAPVFPLFYAVFSSDRSGKHHLQIRVIKISALLTLVIGDTFYSAIVLLNNIPVLLQGAGS